MTGRHAIINQPKKPRGSQSVLRGVASSGTAGISSLAVGIITLPIIISTLGASGYGVWLVTIAATNYLYFADFGIGASIVHFGSRTRNGDTTTSMEALLATGLMWMFIAAAVVVPANYLFADWYANNHAVAAGLSDGETTSIICCASILAGGIVLRLFPSVLAATGRLATERYLQIWGVALRLVGIIAACLVFESLVGVVLAETAALLVPNLLSAVISRDVNLLGLRPHHISRAQISMMFNYGGRAFTVNALGAALLQAGTLITGLVSSPSSVTYFNAANRLYLGVRQVLTWITDPLRPTLSRLLATRDDLHEAGIIVRIAVTISIGIALLAAVVGCIGARGFIELWLGRDVPITEIATTLSILLVGLAINAAHVPLIPALDAAGYPGTYVKLQFAWLVSTVALATILGNWVGIAGVAAGMSLPLVVIEPLYLRKAASLLPTGPQLFDWRFVNFYSWVFTLPIVPAGGLGFATGFVLHVNPWLSCAAWYAVFAIATAIARKGRLPVDDIRTTFSSKL